MLAFLGRRALQSLVVLFLLSLATRALLNAMPGDPLDALKRSSPRPLSAADIERLKQHYGLDDPFPLQYLKWLRQLGTGDLGHSRSHQAPVQDLLWPALGRSLLLGLSAMLLAVPTAILLGVRSATAPGTCDDVCIRASCYLGISMPTFWLCLLLLLCGSVRCQWFPPDAQLIPGSESWTATAHALVLPVVALAVPLVAEWTRYVRAGLQDVLGAEYLVAARARGVGDKSLLWRHALPNALVPFFSVLGQSLPLAVGGELVVETVFAWPGLGQLEYSAVRDQDYNVAMPALMLIAAATLAGGLLADVLHAAVDPRVRHRLFQSSGGVP